MKLKRRQVLVILGAVILAIAVSGGWLARKVLKDPVPYGEPTPRPQGPEWIDLLDAAHAPGWKNTADDNEIFEIKDGMLHIFGRSLATLRYAGYTPEKFGDFDLHLEFKVARRANSGVFLRATPNDPVYRGFEVQVLDDFGKAPNKNGCGSIYDVTTPMYNLSRPAGEWNSFDISLRGGEVQVRMNGWLVVHTDLAQMTMKIGKYKAPFAELPREGNLLLQDHGGEAWYRNILIRKTQM